MVPGKLHERLQGLVGAPLTHEKAVERLGDFLVLRVRGERFSRGCDLLIVVPKRILNLATILRDFTNAGIRRCGSQR